MKKVLYAILICLLFVSYSKAQTPPSITVSINLDGHFSITNTTTINWNYWDLEYGPVGFTPGTGTTVSNINTATKTLQINPFLSYDIRTRNKITNYTYPWSSIYTFSNCESLYPVDYTTDFATIPTSDCWRGYTSPVYSTSLLVAHQTTGIAVTVNTIKMQVQGTTGSAFLVAPKFEAMATDKKISFTTVGSPGTELEFAL